MYFIFCSEVLSPVLARGRSPGSVQNREPFELGCNPDRSSRTPAFISSSLYLVIAAMSSFEGMTPASDSLLAFTIIMNRIVLSPSEFVSLPISRTAGGQIDIRSKKFYSVSMLQDGRGRAQKAE